MEQKITVLTNSRKFTNNMNLRKAMREYRQIKLRTIEKPAQLNKIFRKKGKILDVMILDLTIPTEDLNRFIFYIKQYKKDLPVFLLCLDQPITEKNSEAFRNLAVYGTIKIPSNKIEAEEILDDLNKILDLDMDKKLYKVKFLEKENVFACTFKNMKTYFLKRKDIPGDDGSKIKHYAIDEDEYCFRVYLDAEPEQEYTVPWDFILHMCEDRYEFSKNKSVERISSEEIGKRVKKERGLRHLRQEDLAKKTGILRANIARIEKGKHYPALETLEKIAKALKVPVAKFLAR